MSMLLDRAIADSRQRSSGFLDRMKAFGDLLASTGRLPSGPFGGQGILGSKQGSAPTLASHAEQYRHFSGWVFASIRPIAQRIAGQPVRVARKTAGESAKGGLRPKKEHLPRHLKQQAEGLELIEEHPILKVLQRPNPAMLRWHLMYCTVASLELTGKAYWWFHRDEDGKEEIWPVPASWMKPVHTAERLFDCWIMQAGGVGGGEVKLPREAVAYMYYPDPADPLGALSPLSAQSRAVVGDEAISEAQRKSFQSIFPGMGIVVGRHPDLKGGPGERPMLTKDQKNQIITAIKQAYRGVMSFDEPIILDGLIEDIKPLTNTPRELAFQNSAGLTKERIMQGFGTSPYVIGGTEPGSRAASAVAEQHFLDSTVNPKIELISECLTVWINPLYEDDPDDLICYIEPCQSRDVDYELLEEDALMANGAMSINERRQRHGLTPLPPEQGDVCYIDPNKVPVPMTKELADRWIAAADAQAAAIAEQAVQDATGQSGQQTSGTTGTIPPEAGKSARPFPPGPIVRSASATEPAAVLDVPDIRQAASYDCGPACFEAVARFWGLDDAAVAVGRGLLDTTPEGGTEPEDLAESIREVGLLPVLFGGDRELQSLRTYLALGWPVICPVQWGGTEEERAKDLHGHYVVALGLTDDTVTVHDPVGGRKTIGVAEWLGNWHDRDADGQPRVCFGIAVGKAEE